MYTTYYTDKKYLPEGVPHIALLYPFWGAHLEPSNIPDAHRMEALTHQGAQYYGISSNIKEARAGILPFAFLRSRACLLMAHQMATDCADAGIPLFIFYNADDDKPLTIPHAILFRTSALASQTGPRVHGLPGWSTDFLTYFPNQIWRALEKKERPSVGYCGYVDYLHPGERIWKQFRQTINERLLRRTIQTDKGSVLRGMAVRSLLQTKNIDAQFIIRSGFWGGKIPADEARKVYADNMINHPYTLTIRGAGNFSYRLYEVMSCGRIPILVNTDCLLPFPEWIPWKEISIWVEEESLSDLAETIIAFHQSLSPDAFIALQDRNRAIYEEWLSPLGFAKNMYRYIPTT
jgi:hypothetical protein